MLHPVTLTAGIDEAGRGALFGPVVAAAVCLDERCSIAGIRDSKKLTPSRREQLAVCIGEQAIDCATGMATAAEVDEMNVLEASMLAMQRAFGALSCQPDLVVIDGNRCPQLPCPGRAMVGGDGLHLCVAAASIIAKVTRDRLLIEQEAIWPGYGLARHKGYPTAEHLRALDLMGPCAGHRRSFGPVRDRIRGAAS